MNRFRGHRWVFDGKTLGGWCSFHHYRCEDCGDTYVEEYDALGCFARDIQTPERASCPGRPSSLQPEPCGGWLLT